MLAVDTESPISSESWDTFFFPLDSNTARRKSSLFALASARTVLHKVGLNVVFMAQVYHILSLRAVSVFAKSETTFPTPGTLNRKSTVLFRKPKKAVLLGFSGNSRNSRGTLHNFTVLDETLFSRKREMAAVRHRMHKASACGETR